MNAAYPSEYAVCQKAGCGRPFVLGVHDEELPDWFIAPRLSGGWVFRCPRHVTRWCFREAGLAWTNERRARAARALANDLARYPVVTPGYRDPVPTTENVRRVRTVWRDLISPPEEK